MNHMTLMGHLGADPEVRHTPNGQKVTTLRLAANQRRGGKDETMWWKVTIWGDHLDKMISFLKKGSSVIVHGEMNKPETYTDKAGQFQVALTITAQSLSFNPFGRSDKSEGGYQGGAGAQNTQAANNNAFQSAAPAGQQPQADAGNNPFASFGDSGSDQIPF